VERETEGNGDGEQREIFTTFLRREESGGGQGWRELGKGKVKEMLRRRGMGEG
jgi:hypothetical protein